jgi:hypothetical protein
MTTKPQIAEPAAAPEPARQQVRVRQSSVDGAISVAVDLDGRIVDLCFADAVLQRSATQLANDVLACLRSAQATTSQWPPGRPG